MTDHNREEREALIEKAAKALTGLTDAEWEVATVEGTDHLTSYFEAAERVWAVFEQAHTPTEHECTWACWVDRYDQDHHAPTDGEREDLDDLEAMIAVEADDVVVTCPECGEEQYERVIYDD